MNKEISELIFGLISATKILKKNGVLAVVTFHSIEDKIVKYFLNIYLKKEVYRDIYLRLINLIFCLKTKIKNRLYPHQKK